jgi:hypothetical protein
MKQNLIKYWKNFILQFKWKNGLISYPILFEDQINKIIATLENFFPDNYFLAEQSKAALRKDQNWIHLILSSDKISSVFQLNEISDLLAHYNSIEVPGKNIFIKENGEVDNTTFRDKIFEVFINDLLHQNGLECQINQFYLTEEGNKKPLDSYFNFNGKEYLVECKKIYNSKMQNLKILSWNLEKRFKIISEKYSIYPDQLFSGYIGFKSKKIDEKIINQAEEKFIILVKQYFIALSPQAKDILIPSPIETDNLLIDFKPIYLRDFEECIKISNKEYENSICFSTQAKNPLKGQITAHFRVNVTHNSLIRQTRELISDKFNQHKQTKYCKIVAIEIENSMIDNELGNSLPLSQEDFRSKDILSLIRENRSLLVVFKNITDTGIQYKFGFIHNNSFDRKLSNILNQPKFKRFSA